MMQKKVGVGELSEMEASQMLGARLWPTLSSRDYRSGKGRKDNGHTPQLPEVVGGTLNPTWVELLMGFPMGWTDLET